MNKWPLIAAGLVLATPACGETLREAVATAYASNPELAAARARQEALAEAPEQARALGRPSADGGATAGYDRLGVGRAGTVSVGATLPVWTGGRVSSAVRAANNDVAAGAEGLRDTEAAILESVVAAYADLLYNQQAVEVARVGIERLDAQVAEARSRFGLGQATRTDVAQLEAQRSSVVANMADAEGTLATVAAAYRSIVGQSADALSTETPPPTALPTNLETAREAAQARNPLLLQQRRVADAAAARIGRERAERSPFLALNGAYGYGGRIADERVRGYEAAASAGLALRVPLLTGGLVSSRVRQAEATYRAERFQIDAAAREAIRGADAAWATLIAARARLKANVDGLAAADLALKGVRAEYSYGLRSTIDILVADQSFRAAQLAVARSRSDVLIAQAALLRATGRLSGEAYA